MSTIRLLGIAGSPSRPSRTRALVDAVVSTVAQDPRVQGSIVDLTDVLPELGQTLDPRQAPPRVAALIAEIADADALVVGSPVYKGTYSGLFKHLFDLIDPKLLRGKPVVITATGGSDRHALALDHGLRPLFAFFNADIIPRPSTGGERIHPLPAQRRRARRPHRPCRRGTVLAPGDRNATGPYGLIFRPRTPRP